MAKRLTELQAERVKPVAGKRLELFDGPGGIPGLSLRITPRGVKSWALMYRIGGHQKRLTLGRYPVLGLAEARVRARAALEAAERGINPGLSLQQRDNFAAAADQYLELHVRRNKLRRAADVERMLRPVIATWGARPIRSIVRADVLELIDRLAARAPVMANRVQSLLGRLFRWAVGRGLLEGSPLAGLRAPARERSRERVLGAGELRDVWRGCEGLGWPWGPIVRLLILTGARRSEVTGLVWSEVEGPVWVKPATRTKSGREHRLPLSSAALSILAELPRVDGSAWVFPKRDGSGPVNYVADAKARLDRLSGVVGWTIHDIRRSVATGLVERCDAAPHVVAEVLGHAPSVVAGVTAIYQRHRFDREVRVALERWGEYVLRLGADEKIPLEV